MREGIVVEVITLQRKEPQPFTRKQIELVTTFADQAVIAIENVRLFDEVQTRTQDLSESLEQQTATSEVLRVISSSPGQLEPVFSAMLENAVRICGAKFGILLLSEDDGFRTVAMHGVPPAYAEARRRDPVTRHAPGTALGHVLMSKQPAQVADVQSEPAYYNDPSLAALLKLAGARSVVAVPMVKEDHLVCYFHLPPGTAIHEASRTDENFASQQSSPSKRRLLTDFANPAATDRHRRRVRDDRFGG
jgi:GAF domain-containing protein